MSNREFHSTALKPLKAFKCIGLLSFSGPYIFPIEAGIILLAISLVIAYLLMMRSTAKRLNRLDDELKSISATLECKVEERSAELKKSEESYRSILQNASDAIYLTDNTGRLIDMSKSACKMLGYSKEELLQFKFSDIVDPESLKDLPIELPAIPNQPIFKERTLITKDGRKIYVEINGQRIDEDRLMGVARDITERRRVEIERKKTAADLKASEANLQTILNNTDTGYALLNTELDIVKYNKKVQVFVQNEFNFKLSGTGKFYDFLPEERRLKFLAYTCQVFGGEIISYEISYPQADGMSSWYYIRMSPIADKGEQILGLLLEIADITARKAAEQSIRDHLEKIREMSWKQSHLIRSPLANLKGLFQIIKANPTDREVFRLAETELERLDQILREENE